MTARTLFVLFVVAAAVASGAHADQLLLEVIQHGSAAADNEDAPEIEVVLGINAALTSAFSSSDGRTYTARLADSADALADWQYTELTFREDDYDITSVEMEGSSARGLTLRVTFAQPVAAVSLPQYVSNRIALKYLPSRSFDRVARRHKDTKDRQFWAVDLGRDEPPLSLQQMPRSLLLNRALYAAPTPTGPGNIRLGVFEADKAKSVLRQAVGQFPNAAVVPISSAEAAYAQRMRLNSPRLAQLYSGAVSNEPEEPAPSTAPRIDIAIGTPGSSEAPPATEAATLSDWQSVAERSLLQDAKSAYLAGDYDRAIALYTQASEDRRYRAEALEMLGVAREQKRQFAQAKLCYETLLAELPDGPAAERVDARLQALLRMNDAPRTLRRPELKPEASWNTTATLSQFYRRYSLDISGHQRTVPIDGLFSDLDLSTRRVADRSTHEARIGLGHVQDFTERGRSQGVRAHTLYWESTFDRLGTSARVGRQHWRKGGVLGRFDGIAAGLRATPHLRINALGGYLLDSSYDDPDTSRPFWGVNTEIGLLDDALVVTPFFVQQKYDGVLDRQALGLQAELYTQRGSHFGMLDYDLHHDALNHAYLSSNLQLTRRLRIYGTIDHRRNPYLTTRNALIGQPLQDLSELELQLVEDDLEDIAADRTAVSTLVRVGLDQQLGGWTLSTDVSMTDFKATEESLNVAALDAHQDLYLSTQLRADNAFGNGNYGALQVRYYESDDSRTMGMMLNSRFGLLESWWLYPRVAVDQRTQTNSDLKQLRIRPSLRLDYRHARWLRLEMEVGYEWTEREMFSQDLDMQGLFLRAGYRALF